MRLFRQGTYALIFYPATFMFVIGCFAAGLFGSKPLRAVVHAWTDFHHALVRMLGIFTEVRGSIPSGAFLIAVKHQSMFETLEIVRIANTPVIVLKRELSQLPGFGWATRRYGVIPVDRSAGAKALREMLLLGKEAAAIGRPVIIYPEGTRVRPGETPPLQAGFAGLYKALGLPVVPVAMDSGRLWGRNLPRNAGTVHFVVGEPIPAELKREDIEARVHAAINVLESGPQASA
ncbi:lysophospholipid acyltransferase family protein [Sphingomonas daechungensis]|uniref:lysophospholipid acyltransferase family protein n=1 Tax=Sphingomonas daechungensis TaxID=1176646 RepID=UPI0031E881A7